MRADGTVPHAPVVQRVGQHAQASYPVFFSTDAQRDDTDRLAGRANDQHPQRLVAPKMLPVSVEPIECVEKRGAGGQREQPVPQQAVVGKFVQVVYLVDVGHGDDDSGKEGTVNRCTPS